MLTFRNVSFSYKRNRPVLENFSIEFKNGRTLLLGPNGSGKSTIFALASGILKLKSGEIQTDQVVGLLPQAVPIFPNLTVSEQVAYVAWLAMKPMKQAEFDSSKSLEVVHLLDKAKEKPKDLSGGQLRRLGIAGLLNSEAEVMLLDEPTAGLDIAQSASLFKVLKSLPKEKTIVVCTHQLDGISDFFDYVAVIHNGELKFNGTIEEFEKIGQKPANQLTTNTLVNAYAAIVESVI
jgi:ABC-2 type transport system ATP-binding protein